MLPATRQLFLLARASVSYFKAWRASEKIAGRQITPDSRGAIIHSNGELGNLRERNFVCVYIIQCAIISVSFFFLSFFYEHDEICVFKPRRVSPSISKLPPPLRIARNNRTVATIDRHTQPDAGRELRMYSHAALSSV